MIMIIEGIKHAGISADASRLGLAAASGAP
jgi:hypothetical protein